MKNKYNLAKQSNYNFVALSNHNKTIMQLQDKQTILQP